MDSNFTTNHQLNHRTILFFQDKPIPDELMDHLLTVMNRTATSNGLQTASVIRVTDDDKKQQISEVSNQAYIAKAPELFIFLVDAYRMK
nr:nitroreductase family protein [Aerococcus suis]